MRVIIKDIGACAAVGGASHAGWGLGAGGVAYAVEGGSALGTAYALAYGVNIIVVLSDNRVGVGTGGDAILFVGQDVPVDFAGIVDGVNGASNGSD